MTDNPLSDSHIVRITSHMLRTMTGMPPVVSVMGAAMRVIARLASDIDATMTIVGAVMTDMTPIMSKKGATMTDIGAAMIVMAAALSFIVGTMWLSEKGLTGVKWGF